MENFSQLSDEELIKKSTSNKFALDFLISKYSKVIFYKAYCRSDFCNEADDLMQEGMLGLMSAVDTFDFKNGSKFSTYANSCITNRMTNYIIKNNNLNRTNNFFQDDCDEQSPESIMIEKEKAEEFTKEIKKFLSHFELKVFRLFLSGSGYDEISNLLHTSTKSVDNAMQRVRKKLKKSWADKIRIKTE